MHAVSLPSDSNANVGMFALLAIPTVRALTASGFALSFLAGAFDVVFVLFCYSPISTGGLGFPVRFHAPSRVDYIYIRV